MFHEAVVNGKSQLEKKPQTNTMFRLWKDDIWWRLSLVHLCLFRIFLSRNLSSIVYVKSVKYIFSLLYQDVYYFPGWIVKFRRLQDWLPECQSQVGKSYINNLLMSAMWPHCSLYYSRSCRVSWYSRYHVIRFFSHVIFFSFLWIYQPLL